MRWHGDTTDGPLHAIVNGAVAGTLIRYTHGPGWTLSPETLRRFPTLYGIGPRALSTWRAKLAGMIRNAPPDAPATDPATDTTDRLKHTRELIIRAVAVLSPIDRDDADEPRVTTARELAAELRSINERIARELDDRPAHETGSPGRAGSGAA